MTDDLRLRVQAANDDITLGEVYQSLDRVLMQLTSLKREHEAIIALIIEHLGPIEYIGLDDLVRNLLQLTVTQKALIEKMKSKEELNKTHPIMWMCVKCGAAYSEGASHVCAM